ncbi:unnamed protein product [Ixodes persulcatus]
MPKHRLNMCDITVCHSKEPTGVLKAVVVNRKWHAKQELLRMQCTHAGFRMMEHGRGRSIRDFTFEWCWQSVRAQLLMAVPRLGAISNLLCELNRNISIFHLSKNIYAILCQANTSAQTFFYCMQPNLPTQLYQSPLIFPHYHAVIVTFDILLYLFQIISPFWKKQKKQRRKGMQIDGAHKYRHRSAQTAAKK